MNLTSCSNCGVMLDKDNLPFPYTIYDGDGNVDDDKAMWNGDKWVSCCKCPVCGEKIKDV